MSLDPTSIASSNTSPIILAVIEPLVIQHLLTAYYQSVLQRFWARVILEWIVLKACDWHIARKGRYLKLHSRPLERRSVKDDVLARNRQQLLWINSILCINDTIQTFAILRTAIDETAFGEVGPSMFIRDEPTLSKVADLQHGTSKHFRHELR